MKSIAKRSWLPIFVALVVTVSQARGDDPEELYQPDDLNMFRVRWEAVLGMPCVMRAEGSMSLTDGRVVAGRLVRVDAVSGRTTVISESKELQLEKDEIDEIVFAPDSVARRLNNPVFAPKSQTFRGST